MIILKMAETKLLKIFCLVLGIGLTRIFANSGTMSTCDYELISLSEKDSTILSFDVDLVYSISDSQSGCFLNVDNIYENITKLVDVIGTKIKVSLRFFCGSSEDGSDLHFTCLETNQKINYHEFSFKIVLEACSLYIDELAYFQQYGHIISLDTSKGSYIHQGLSCSSLNGLQQLSSTLVCIESNKNETIPRKTFFWEVCDPFEKLINLELKGCKADFYYMNASIIQSKFPNLETLWLEYMNLTQTELTFPWTNDASHTDIVPYYSHFKGNNKHISYTFLKTIDLYDSAFDFTNDVNFVGSIYKIVLNYNKIPKIADTVFMKISGLVLLDLSFNGIKEVDKHAFRKQNKLEALNLANNKLTDLAEGVFDGLSNLLYLDLSCNTIIEVKQSHFKYMDQLRELNLRKNDIKTLPHDFLDAQINSIQYLLLSENPLQTLPLKAFYAPKLLLVDMRLCHIDTSSLQTLLYNIDFNKLKTAYKQSLTSDSTGMTGKFPLKARSFDLSQNNITEIPTGAMQNAFILHFMAVLEAFYINLKDNPIDCTCKILNVSEILYEMYDKFGIVIDWKCQHPEELREQFVVTIKPEETYCPISLHECPDRCRCFERVKTKEQQDEPKWKRKLIIDCRNTNMSYLPSVMPVGRLELWFRNSSLLEVSPRDYMENTTDLDVSYNKINRISPITAVALGNISTLKLDHNNMTHIPIQIAAKNMSLITLSNNPFICDCNTKWMKAWLLKRNTPVRNRNNLECTYNTSMVGTMVNLSDSVFVCKEKLRIHGNIFFSSMIIGSILFVLVSVSLLISFQRFTIKVLLYLYCGLHPFDKQSQKQTENLYDAFIIYWYTDSSFIQNNLIGNLRSKGYSIIDFHKDMFVGFSILQNVEIYIKRSKRIIFCWDESMLKNDLILSAWNMAYEKAMKNDQYFLILIVDGCFMKGSFTPDNLRRFIKRGRYIRKQSKYMLASVEYLMPKISSNIAFEIPIDESGKGGSSIPMLEDFSGTVNCHRNELIYISYPDGLDFEIRRKLIPYLLKMGKSVKVFEHDFTPGADIREEIHSKLDASQHFIFIISQSSFNDDVKMFILKTVMSKSALCNNNYLLLFTSGRLHETDLHELNYYFDNFVTGSVRDDHFKIRLLQSLSQDLNSA